MAIVRRKGELYQARQLIGNSEQTAEVTEWITQHGFPWLLGDATKPNTLAPKGGKPGDPGIYIDPEFGEIVFHLGNESQRAGWTDWILLKHDGTIQVYKKVFFDAQFEVVSE